MSFLKRHRSQRPAQDGTLTTHSNSDGPQANSTKGTPASTHSPSLRRNITASALSLFTSKLSPRPHPKFPRRPKAPPVSNTSLLAEWDRHGAEDDSASDREPSLDIRMPAGLGRRASSSSSASASQTPPHRRLAASSLHGRTRRRARRSGSAHASMGSVRAADLTDILLELDVHVQTKVRAPAECVPTEVLAAVFAHAERADRVALACTAKAFVAPALRALYSELNLMEAKDERVGQCIATLASKRYIARLVRSFGCSTLPSSTSSSSFSTLTFGIAFSNMHELKSLTLPQFDAPLLLHTSFRLQKFVVLQESMSPGEFRDMMAWLPSQPAITHFALPRLVMNTIVVNTAETADKSANAKGSDVNLDIEPSSTFPTSSSRALPRLTYLEAPAAVSTILAPGRPLECIAVWIHNTLYDGLRPSALMSALTRSSVPLQKVIVKAASCKIDARTLERVLMAAGAELGDLEVLEVHWVLEDEILYKHILHVLPRFRALHTLRFRRRLPPPPPSSPPPACLPPPSPSPSTARPKTASRSNPPSPASTLSSRRRSTGTLVSPEMPLPRAHERGHLALWCKSCPTLRSVVFLSGAEWRADCKRSVVAPTLSFVGLVSE